MKKGKMKISGKINMLISLIITVIIIGSTVSITYAVNKNNDENANVVVEVHANKGLGNDKLNCVVVSEGNLFGNNLWYPGYSKSGVIKIENQWNKDVNINNIGVKVTIADPKNTPEVYKSFLNNMHFTINPSKLLIFQKSIVDDENMNDIAYKEGSDDYNGYDLLGKDKVKVDKDGDIYLHYTLTMDPNAGKELMDLTANLELTIGFDEIDNGDTGN